MDIVKARLKVLWIFIQAVWAKIELPLVGIIGSAIIWVKNAILAIIRQVFSSSE